MMLDKILNRMQNKRMYRTHLCKEVNLKLEFKTITIAGWVRKKRNHGTILFIDIYDASSMVQCLIEKTSPLFEELSKINNESIVSFTGIVKKRTSETINKNITTGEIELEVTKTNIISKAQELPFALTQKDLNEELQLKYRFLYLRTPQMQEILKLRTEVIDFLRNKMKLLGFQEIQTPLLSSSSPEGARDYLVPSRLNKGKFFALPQAPQQFKQLLMASGIEKYFQIAPCFRDEDSRADRLLGEFYQLDFELAFASQEDILILLEDILTSLFNNYNHKIEKFEQIKYIDAIKNYGTDKPDLRNPLKLIDITDMQEPPKIFEKMISEGGKLIAIPCKSDGSRKFIQEMTKIMQDNGAQGLAYAVLKEEWSGPISKMLNISIINKIVNENDNTIFLIAADKQESYKLAGILRSELAVKLNLINENEYKFCFITDFPMFEKKDGTWQFTHNPFSMPNNLDDSIEKITSMQYDVVCNGYEITSGAVRNHDIKKIQKAFALVDENYDLEKRFPLFKAFKYGIPPHAGAAPGIDRIIMLLSKKKNVRDIVAFPLNQKGENLLMEAPSEIDKNLLKELNLKLIDN